MDRRQRKSRTAIFDAFSMLLSKKQYNKITIQELIDAADVGRSTFYAHFETKEALLQAFCESLFNHIIESATDHGHTHGRYSDDEAPASVFCHILQHLQKNDHNILVLFACESSDIFLRYFKNGINQLVKEQFINHESVEMTGLPEDFVINYISGSFVEMIQWWSKNGRKETPEQLDVYFKMMMPAFIHPEDACN